MIRRNAYSLVELMVTMSIGSSLMLLAVGLVHQSLSLSSSARAAFHHHRSIDRIARDFRGDVHLATDSRIERPDQLELVHARETLIRYVANGTEVRREERIGGKVQRSETYQLDPSLSVAFESLNEPNRVQLIFASELPVAQRAGVPSRHIIAVMGRRLDHERGEVQP